MVRSPKCSLKCAMEQLSSSDWQKLLVAVPFKRAGGHPGGARKSQEVEFDAQKSFLCIYHGYFP